MRDRSNLGRPRKGARILAVLLEAAVVFTTATEGIAARWPVTYPTMGWSLVPWVALGVLGAGYACVRAHQVVT